MKNLQVSKKWWLWMGIIGLPSIIFLFIYWKFEPRTTQLQTVESNSLLNTGACKPDGECITALAVSAYSPYLVVGTQKGLYMYDQHTLERLYFRDVGAIHSLAFNLSGDQFVSKGTDTIIWDAEHGKRLASWETYWFNSTAFGNTQLAWSPDDEYIVVGRDSHSITLYSLSNQELERFEIPELPPTPDPKSKTFTLYGSGYRIPPPPWDVVWSNDGKWLAFGIAPYTTGPTVVIWDMFNNAPKAQFVLGDEERPMTGLTFSPDGQYMVGSTNHDIFVWSMETGKLVHTFSSPRIAIISTTVRWSPTDSAIAFGDSNGVVIVLDPISGRVQQTLVGHTDSVIGQIWFDLTGGKLFTASFHEVIIWNLTSGQALHTLAIEETD